MPSVYPDRPSVHIIWKLVKKMQNEKGLVEAASKQGMRILGRSEAARSSEIRNVNVGTGSPRVTVWE